MQHHLVAAPVRFFGNLARIHFVRQYGDCQRIWNPQDGIGLRALVAQIVDYDR